MITNRKKMIAHPDRGAPADRAGADPVAEHVATWTRESEAVDCQHWAALGESFCSCSMIPSAGSFLYWLGQLSRPGACFPGWSITGRGVSDAGGLSSLQVEGTRCFFFRLRLGRSALDPEKNLAAERKSPGDRGISIPR